MSALSYICGYGYGSSDESDCELERLNAKRSKLPAPNLSRVSVVPSDVHEDDPDLHGGRARSFPHERGNWATFVYLSYPQEDRILLLIDKIQRAVSATVECQICDDFHISLSKTVVLRYHQIKPFTTSLQDTLVPVKSFDLSFDSVKIYCNQEQSRTFIALKVDQQSQKYVCEVTEKIDQLLVDFKLPEFYEDPSFHMSILWVNGNKQEELAECIECLNNIVTEVFTNDQWKISIKSVNCKTGNKFFEFSLQ